MYAYARFFILERLQVVIITKVHRERGLGPLILEREHLYVFLVGSSFCRGLGPQNQIWHSKIRAPNPPCNYRGYDFFVSFGHIIGLMRAVHFDFMAFIDQLLTRSAEENDFIADLFFSATD